MLLVVKAHRKKRHANPNQYEHWPNRAGRVVSLVGCRGCHVAVDRGPGFLFVAWKRGRLFPPSSSGAWSHRSRPYLRHLHAIPTTTDSSYAPQTTRVRRTVPVDHS